AAGVIVAGRAVNVVALPAALQILAGDRERESLRKRAVDLALIEVLVDLEVPACDRARHHRAFRAAIVEKAARLIGLLFGLDVHVQAASAERERQRCETRPLGEPCRDAPPLAAPMMEWLTLQSQTLQGPAGR